MLQLDSRFEQARNKLLRVEASDPTSSEQIHSVLTELVTLLEAPSTAASSEQQQERFLLDRMLRNFRLEDSRAYHFFVDRGWSELPVPVILSIAEILAKETNIPMNREVKRRKVAMFYWMEKHWDSLKSHAELMGIEWLTDDTA
jgi:hypothetical protein